MVSELAICGHAANSRREYVLNQEEHHRVKTFQEEYQAMLQRGMVEYDERFLW